MNDNTKEILKLAAELVLTRQGDVTTTDGDFATVDTDLIIRLDEALAREFTNDSDDVNFENIEMLLTNIKASS